MRRTTGTAWTSTDGHSLVLAAEFRTSGVRAVRHQVGHAARRCGMRPDRVDVFVLAINEVMNNAVRHGGGHGRLRLWYNGDLLCQIDDEGSGFDASSYVDRTVGPTPSPSGGMGLWLVQQTCDKWAVDSSPSGTTVYVGAVLRPDQET